MLIIFLLVLVVASAIVLSVASRTITDVRITSTTDESNRAYFAAEAGIEEALKKLDTPSDPCTSACSFNLTFTNTDTTVATKVTKMSESYPTFIYPNPIPRDSVAQFSLLSDFSLKGSGLVVGAGATNVGTMTIYWGDPVNVDPLAIKPAVEVTLVYYCSGGSPCPGGYTGDFGAYKYIFDPDSTRAASNNFCPASSGSFPLSDAYTNKTMVYRATITHNSALTCGSNSLVLPDNTSLALVRVRLLYDNSPEPIALNTGVYLPAQGVIVDANSAITSGSGVTRNLQVTRLYSSMSSLFDYGLFNGNTDLHK
jgi:hypothetical protein